MLGLQLQFLGAETTVAVVRCCGLLLSYVGTTIAVSGCGATRHLWNAGPTIVVGPWDCSCCYGMRCLKLLLWMLERQLLLLGA